MYRKVELIQNTKFNQNYHSNPFFDFKQKTKKIRQNGKSFEQILQEMKQNFN